MAPVTPEEADSRAIDLDDLLVRPGTYFNPQTEVVVVVDDSVSIDQEVFNMEAYEGADWVRIADDLPIDTDALDTVLERFQTLNHPGTAGLVFETAREGDELVEEEEELEPDPDPEEEDG